MPWSFNSICCMAFGTECEAAEKVIPWAEMPHVPGNKTALVEVAQDTISGFFLSSPNPAAASGMMFALCKQPNFPTSPRSAL